MLRATNALGLQSTAMILTLWTFVLSNTFGTLVASPTIGIIGSLLFIAFFVYFTIYLAPIRYLSAILLQEEVQKTLSVRGGSFVRGEQQPLGQRISAMMSSV